MISSYDQLELGLKGAEHLEISFVFSDTSRLCQVTAVEHNVDL